MLAVVFIAVVMDVIDASIATLAGLFLRAELGGRATIHAVALVTGAIKQAEHTCAHGNAPHYHSTRKEHT